MPPATVWGRCSPGPPTLPSANRSWAARSPVRMPGPGAAGYAGRMAVRYGASDGEIEEVAETLTAPLRRSGGFGPHWVTQMLQNTMIPYYVMYVKHGDRLQAALTNVEFFRDHLVPLLYASDQHELRLVHETRNMVLNAEMRLRASLFRTETRGCHYREDYPMRDDQEWLAWVILQAKGGRRPDAGLQASHPAEWRPDVRVCRTKSATLTGCRERGAGREPAGSDRQEGARRRGRRDRHRGRGRSRRARRRRGRRRQRPGEAEAAAARVRASAARRRRIWSR